MSRLSLQTTCFVIENGQVCEHILADFDEFIVMVPGPVGIAPKYFVRENDGKHELCYYSHGSTNVVEAFEDKAEAYNQLEKIYCEQILENQERTIFLNLENAYMSLEDE